METCWRATKESFKEIKVKTFQVMWSCRSSRRVCILNSSIHQKQACLMLLGLKPEVLYCMPKARIAKRKRSLTLDNKSRAFLVHHFLCRMKLSIVFSSWIYHPTLHYRWWSTIGLYWKSRIFYYHGYKCIMLHWGATSLSQTDITYKSRPNYLPMTRAKNMETTQTHGLMLWFSPSVST
jgi:hypothetical protein